MYFLAVHRHLWVPPFITVKTWGHPNPNIVELINFLLLEYRKLAIVALLNVLWHKVMDLRFTRLNDALIRLQPSEDNSTPTSLWRASRIPWSLRSNKGCYARIGCMALSPPRV